MQRKRDLSDLLLGNIKTSLPGLKALLGEASDHWTYEDGIYRFYHQSFKVYYLQGCTEKIVRALKDLLPGRSLNPDFLCILVSGTGKRFTYEDNSNWELITRPILEAFFHARFFLEMACKYGEELQSAPDCLPSGWAALLYLYNLR